MQGLPHGLPLRFHSLEIRDPGGRSGGDSLVDDLGASLLDLATLGPLRRAYKHASNPARSPVVGKVLIGGVEGVVHQGELLLIIGPPTSNAAILTRGLSCCPDLPLSQDSHLDYGLVPHDNAKRPTLVPHGRDSRRNLRSQVVFMDDRDVHFATLSLEATLRPDALAKTPENRQDGSTRTQWADSLVRSVVETLGLSHALHTAVGSPFVRGLSGGERKRASLAECLLARAAILLLDGPFNGLDSSTAVSMLEYLRKWAIEGKRSIVATTPHCADALYDQFDKVLVLNARGRQVFFGKTSEAQPYFEQRGFQRRVDLGEGTAEFLVACIEGRHNDLELERRWSMSPQRKALLHEIEETYPATYPLETCADPLFRALRDEKSKFTPSTSHYTVSFPRQVAILTGRQYALIRSELPAYTTKTIVNLLLSVTVGTLFFRLPATTEHAFTRGSLLLLSIMFNAYLSLAELGKTIEGRDIVKRQGDYGFFSSSTLAVARVLGDIPLIGVQCLLFGTITYVLAGLQPSLEAFAIYLLFVYATALNLSCLFRMFAAFSPNFEGAIRFCGVALNILVMYAGYFIPTPSMRPWLKWIHYVIDPISYSYEAVLANEFHSLSLACSPDDVVPSGPSYDAYPAEYKTCALPGSSPGSLAVSGDTYLSLTYDFHFARIWRNLGVLALQALAFLVIGVVATEFLHFAPGGTRRVWKRTREVRRRLFGEKWRQERGSGDYGERRASSESAGGAAGNGAAQGEARLRPRASAEEMRLLDDDAAYEDGRDWRDDAYDEEEAYEGSALATPDYGSELDTEMEASVLEGSTLAWHNVSLWIDTPLETRRLLDRVSGYIKPGRVCALLGASGAGKSTLLNVLAGRSPGVVRGTIRVDGVEPNSDFYRTTGYVEQFDLHDDRSSVREALEFSALLRQDASIPDSEKLAYVDEVLELLDLSHLQDAIIGTTSAGLNAEQKKRLTIAVEVVSRPAILFCDEPTTGLDTKSALRVVKLLRRLARTGLAVICTIHQPSAETFSVFDDVLLLQRGGKQVYFGPRRLALPYFRPSNPSEPEPTTSFVNPADFLLDVTKTGVDVPDEELGEVADLDVLSKKWVSSSECQAVKKELVLLGAPVQPHAETTRSARRPAAPSSSVWRQCILLTQRVTKHYYRDPSFSFTKLFTSSVVPLIIGLSFFLVGKEHTIVSFQNRMFSVFLLLFVPVVWMNAIIFKVHALRGLWEARERPSRIYGRTAFVTSLLVSEIPYSIACATAYFVLWYFLVGLPFKLSTIGFSFLLIQTFFFFQSTWALWIVNLSRSLGTVANLLPFFLVAMEAFNGSLMPYKQMPVYYRWLYWVSPFQHYVRAMLAALLHDDTVRCADYEVVSFQPPPGLDCGTYVADYLTTHSGYLLDTAESAMCQFCRMSTGDDFLSTLNISFDDRWMSLGILAAYSLSNVLITYALVFYPLRTPAFIAAWVARVMGSDAVQRKGAEETASEEWAREMAYEREHPEVNASVAHDSFA
ncbi:uncharacterized protein JCM10292_000170 [Rhodotorula paludigena]|uniref:uncharacterized protein n=1 Tax=Rhodotorula paludigena TaxID=86838 RepID=UPI003173AC60